MASPPDDGRRPPLLVRYLLGNVRTRASAIWLVVATVIFVAVALALQDPVLVGIAVIGVVAYGWSILWMDRHGGWASAPEPAEVASGASEPSEVAAADLSRPAPPDLADASSRPLAIEGLRGASFSLKASAPDGATVDGEVPALTRLVARAFATLIVVATVTFLGALYALEADGDPPTGGHLVEVLLDALFGLGFGTFALVVTLQRQRLPGGRVLSFIASAGLGLVGGLGYFVAGGLAAADLAGPGTLAAWLIGAAAAGAGVWLTATSGGLLGLAMAIPAVLIGWFLGFAFWIAHLNAV